MNRGLTERDYREYLINLIPSIFKLLPLYEEKNEYLIDFIDSLLHFELYGATEAIGDLPKGVWYGKTITTLEGIEKHLRQELSDPEYKDNHKRFKREIFKITALIDKQIDQLRGG
ncbi:hypothetical protein [Sporosarcina sp. FSL W7-1283]|uniref:hypothetical protein n=1 Tax=Sporosarcina sp. FSL W7-1283 TaxID=2921560 RepID=UPI0030F7EBD5